MNRGLARSGSQTGRTLRAATVTVTRSREEPIQQVDGLFLFADRGINGRERFRHLRAVESIDTFRKHFGGPFRFRNCRILLAQASERPRR